MNEWARHHCLLAFLSFISWVVIRWKLTEEVHETMTRKKQLQQQQLAANKKNNGTTKKEQALLSTPSRRSLGLLDKLLLTVEQADVPLSSKKTAATSTTTTMSDDPFAWHPFVLVDDERRSIGAAAAPRKTVTFGRQWTTDSSPSTTNKTVEYEDDLGTVLPTVTDPEEFEQPGRKKDSVSSPASVSSWEPLLYGHLSAVASSGSEDEDDEVATSSPTSPSLKLLSCWDRLASDVPRATTTPPNSNASCVAGVVLLVLVSLSLLGTSTTPPPHVAPLTVVRSLGITKKAINATGRANDTTKWYLSGKLRVSTKESGICHLSGTALVPTRHITLPLDQQAVQQFVDRLWRRTTRGPHAVAERFHRAATGGMALFRFVVDDSPASQEARRAAMSATFNPARQPFTVALVMDAVDTMMLN